MRNFLILITLLSVGFSMKSQVVYEHVSNTNIYNFLDEMANEKYIQLNSLIKPYSRIMIYEKLNEVKEKADSGIIKLNKRQNDELSFYLDSYILESNRKNLDNDVKKIWLRDNNLALVSNPPGLVYKDTIFACALQPVIGAYYSNNQNGNLTHTWGGASFFGYIGKHLGISTSVRDNNVSQPIVNPDYITHMPGVPIKNYGSDGIDYSEARGSMMYSWNWGAIGIVKDHIVWGTGYNGTNIQSGRAPSFAQIKLELKPVDWFEFNYYHGWLVSDVVDSASSYWSQGTYRAVYYPKYIAANMFTFFPLKYLNVSIGNSIVYSDLSGGGPHPAYLIPFLFYKSVDHTLNSTYSGGETGQNAQMFLNISSRNIRYTHLYFSLFIDDLSFGHFKESEEHNFFSYKGGMKISNFPISNISFTSEFTITNPFVYQHKIETQTYASNKYSMGHYLRDNSTEMYFSLEFKPIRGLHALLSYTFARHYADYKYEDCALNPDCDLHTVPIFTGLTWQNQELLASVRYEIVNNTYVFTSFIYRNITGQQDYIEKYTPEYYWGKTGTFTFGCNVGF